MKNHVKQKQEDMLIGQTLNNTYKIEEKIGKGGMSAVYKATHITSGDIVAVKIVHPGNQFSSDLMERFYREARILCELKNHPNIVNIIECGKAESGLIFIAMEYLIGKTLNEVIPPNQGLSLSKIRQYMAQICKGLQAVHSKNLVHRDLKPQNIFIAWEKNGTEVVKVMDFGIAKAPDQSQITEPGTPIGTPTYISPEQIEDSTNVDKRSDIYALGAILYFMVSGLPAYTGKTTYAVYQKQLQGPPEPIDFQKLGKSDAEAQALSAIIAKAMEREPANRYNSADDFMQDVENACANILSQAADTYDLDSITAINAIPTGGSQEMAQTRRKLIKHLSSPVKNKKERFLFPTVLFVLALIVIALIVAILLTIILVEKKDTKPLANKGPNQTTPLTTVNKDPNQTTPPTTVNKDPNQTTTTHPTIEPVAPVNKDPKVLQLPGISDAEILFGMSAPFSGYAEKLGRGLKLGIVSCFQAINDEGGVYGRKLTLLALDDGYQANRAAQNMQILAEEKKVFALVGNVGTHTAGALVPYVLEKKLLLFGVFSGAGAFRQVPPDRYVFNYRASTLEEATALVKYLVDIKNILPEQIAVFAQDDPLSKTDSENVAKALRNLYKHAKKMLRVVYQKDSILSVDDAAKTIANNKERVRAVIMLANYHAAARLIEKVRDSNVEMIFASLSCVGSDALAEELQKHCPQYAAGVIVTQTVPHYASNSTFCIQYRERLKKYFPEEQPSFISLEGYITASILVEGVRKAGQEVTSEKLINALETLRNLDLGIGKTINFGSSEHQGSHEIWGTILDKDSRYQLLELD
jgi:serine/threonine protein kinase